MGELVGGQYYGSTLVWNKRANNMGLRFNANILKVIFDLRISCTDTVKSWYGGHWSSGIPWNSGQNCTDCFFIK